MSTQDQLLICTIVFLGVSCPFVLIWLHEKRVEMRVKHFNYMSKFYKYYSDQDRPEYLRQFKPSNRHNYIRGLK